MNNDKNVQRIDYGIILTVMLLGLMSVGMIYSTTALMEDAGIRATIMQIAWYGLGAIAVAIIMQFDSEQLWKMTTYLYVIGIVLLVLTLLIYDRTPFILMLSKIVTRHNNYYTYRDYNSDFKLIGKLTLFALIPILLVQLQNDLGTTLVYLAVFVGIILLSGIKWQILLPAFILVAGSWYHINIISHV